MIAAFNASNPDEAREAFARLDDKIADRRAELRSEEARSKHAQATLLYPFHASKAEPLLCAAAYLAQENVQYWRECRLRRTQIGDLNGAEAALVSARRHITPGSRADAATLLELGDVDRGRGYLFPAAERDQSALALFQARLEDAPTDPTRLRDVSVSLNKVGDVHVAQGDLTQALAAYEQGLEIAQTLAQQDPGNAGWSRDLVVSNWKLAQADPGNAVAHWGQVVQRLEDMQARGILLPTDERFLPIARDNLTAARAAQ